MPVKVAAQKKAQKKTKQNIRRKTSARAQTTLELVFDDNQLVSPLYGPHNCHLSYLEERLEVALRPRGNLLQVSGAARDVQRATQVLKRLWQDVKSTGSMDVATLDAALIADAVGPEVAGLGAGGAKVLARALGEGIGKEGSIPEGTVGRGARSEEGSEAADLLTRTGMPPGLRVGGRLVRARTQAQHAYLKALAQARMVFCLGPAGTGKTFLAVAYGMALLEAGEVDAILLTRPAVEAGERLGFLPGDVRDKVDPYLQPLYDALRMLTRPEKIEKMIAAGTIDIAPLAFMRGRTLARAFIVLDEAQNTTASQMKMFLTRLGPQGRMVIVGDPSQVDVQGPSGLKDAQRVLADVPGIHFHTFTGTDVVRDDLVAKVVAAYERKGASGAQGHRPGHAGRTGS